MYISTSQRERDTNPKEAAKCGMMVELWATIVSAIQVLLCLVGETEYQKSKVHFLIPEVLFLTVKRLLSLFCPCCFYPQSL